MTAGRLIVVVGGQFGSEAKGHVAARCAADSILDQVRHVAVRVAGPNAGHTVYDESGHKYAFRQLPVAAVVNPDANLVIAAGSEIDLEVLQHEIEMCENRGHLVRERLYVDGEATVLTQAHRDTEAFGEMQKRIGSTQKGIGAARAERIMRRADRVRDYASRDMLNKAIQVTDTAPLLASALAAGDDVVVEGTQGFGLGLHAGYYPKCTSSDCRAVDFLSMAGIHPWQAGVCSVVVVARVYPIRVAGDSGPLLGETTWKALGLPEEYTTVTKKVRRVGEWDGDLVGRAIRANGGPSSNVMLAITMLDQKFPEVAGLTGLPQEFPTEAAKWVNQVSWDLQTRVMALGTGPRSMVVLP